MNRLPLAAALSLLPFAAAPAPQFDPVRLSNHVRILASDEFEGRGPATAGETKSIAYIVGQMKAAGLQPGGSIVRGKRGWTQDVPLLRASIEGTPRLAFDVAGRAQPLTQGEEIAVRAPLT